MKVGQAFGWLAGWLGCVVGPSKLTKQKPLPNNRRCSSAVLALFCWQLAKQAKSKYKQTVLTKYQSENEELTVSERGEAGQTRCLNLCSVWFVITKRRLHSVLG